MHQPSSSSYKFSAPVMQISSSPNPPSGYLLHTWKRASNFLQCPCVKDCDYQTLDSTTMMVTNTGCKYPESDNAWTDREVVLPGITQYQVKLLQPPTCEEKVRRFKFYLHLLFKNLKSNKEVIFFSCSHSLMFHFIDCNRHLLFYCTF